MRRTRAGQAGWSHVRVGAASLAVGALTAACGPAAVAGPSGEAAAPSIPASLADEPAMEAADAELYEDPPPPEPPPVEAPFALSEAEVYPNAKRLASAVAQALTTYDPDQSIAEVVADLDAVVDPARLTEQARDLHRPGAWSRGRVIYPQLGGVGPERVSVMVTTEQRIGDGAEVRSETRTLDVRLLLHEDAWMVESLASDGGSSLPVPDNLPDEARAVLEDPRIELPDSARWDIIAGEVSPQLLRLMARAADQTPYGVVVLSTGHPFEVFGTDRQSFHTKGRAVDIYRVGERLVIDDREEGSATYRFLEWFYAQPEVIQLGAPWALDGYGGRSFTDVVHQDHLHVGVRAG